VTTPPLPRVRVGQIWADNDRRANGRLVKVVALISDIVGEELVDYALVEQSLARRVGTNGPSEQNRPGRRTRIRISRFVPSSTGYRLVSDVED
jgi:hypothetical protein